MTLTQAHDRLERARSALEARPDDGWALVSLQNAETNFTRLTVPTVPCNLISDGNPTTRSHDVSQSHHPSS